MTKCRNTPSARSVVPAVAPKVAAMMKPNPANAAVIAAKTLGLLAGPELAGWAK